MVEPAFTGATPARSTEESPHRSPPGTSWGGLVRPAQARTTAPAPGADTTACAEPAVTAELAPHADGRRDPAPTHDEVVAKVRDLYARHPFPPPQRRHSYRAHARYVRSVLEGLGVGTAGRRFGDIACGTGLMLADYAGEFPEVELVGYDISETSVARANATLAEEGRANARAVVADLLHLTERESFDYVVSWGTVHHLAEPRQGVEVLARALAPGGVLRLGVYGHYGNWERHLQQEAVRTLGIGMGIEERIELVRRWAVADTRFAAVQTAPPVDVMDDDWVVDEFLHVWERPITLQEAVGWLEEAGLEILHLTDYYDAEISLDPGAHLTDPELVARARGLPFAMRCHLVDLLVRPYWLSLFARKTTGPG